MIKLIFRSLLAMMAIIFAVLYTLSTMAPEEEIWHEVVLEQEFTRKGDVTSFADYLALEDRLFAEVQERIYSETPRGRRHELERYSSGSRADPARWDRNWNRSWELRNENPRGAVLLLHGMSDSPYSLRAIGSDLHALGYDVLGLRFPGHGTIPSGLTELHWKDMAAAARLAMVHLGERNIPIHMMGYSTGAPVALYYTLQQLEDRTLPAPASIVMLSPAIAISPAAALAQWNHRFSRLPGLGGLAWLDIQPEFDPFKYKSFATNAAEQVHGLTRQVANAIASRPAADLAQFPPILVLKSTVDGTTSTSAVVDSMLAYLAPDTHEYLLFDINRRAANSSIFIEDPGPMTDRLLQDDGLHFTVTIVANRDGETIETVARTKSPMSGDITSEVELGKTWPEGMLSLSHIALPFPPDDPLYGVERPEDSNSIFLGTFALQSESNLLRISPAWLLRARHNPFYDYQLERIEAWISAAETAQ